MTTLQHIGHALWGARYSSEKEFALLTCYLDEAIGNGFTVVCGWISTVALWDQFEIDWKLLLASHKIPYFTMKEFSQSTGPFKKWKGAEAIRKRFIGDASSIIRDRVQAGILCNVHHQIFDIANKRYMLRETLSSPYAIAGRACAAQVDLGSRKERVPQDIEFIFEDGGPDKGGLYAAMNVEYRLPDPIFRPSRDIKDKRGNLRNGVVQIQAADFLAYEIRKHRQEFAGRTGRPARRSLYEMLKVPNIMMTSFTRDNAVQLCQIEALLERPREHGGGSS